MLPRVAFVAALVTVAACGGPLGHEDALEVGTSVHEGREGEESKRGKDSGSKAERQAARQAEQARRAEERAWRRSAKSEVAQCCARPLAGLSRRERRQAKQEEKSCKKAGARAIHAGRDAFEKWSREACHASGSGGGASEHEGADDDACDSGTDRDRGGADARCEDPRGGDEREGRERSITPPSRSPREEEEDSAHSNNASENGAIHQEVIDCCQRLHSIAQYQDHARNFQVGHCMRDGQAAVRAGADAFSAWKSAQCVIDDTLASGGSAPPSPGASGGEPPRQVIEEPTSTSGGEPPSTSGGEPDAGAGGSAPGPVAAHGGQLGGIVYVMGTIPLQPLAGANVRVTGAGVRGEITATTDSHGRYLVGGLQTGTHTVEIAGGQREASLVQPVDVDSSRPALLDVQALPALSLSPICSPTAAAKHWRIGNPLGVGLLVWWEIYGSTHRGAVTAPPGASYLTTPAVPGANVLRLLLGRNAVASQSNTPSNCVPEPALSGGQSVGPPPSTLDGSCVGLRPGCGNQVCYQATDSGRCSEVRTDCCCLETYGDVDLWDPGSCNPA
jgi:hypothetical protein